MLQQLPVWAHNWLVPFEEKFFCRTIQSSSDQLCSLNRVRFRDKFHNGAELIISHCGSQIFIIKSIKITANGSYTISEIGAPFKFTMANFDG